MRSKRKGRAKVVHKPTLTEALECRVFLSHTALIASSLPTPSNATSLIAPATSSPQPIEPGLPITAGASNHPVDIDVTTPAFDPNGVPILIVPYTGNGTAVTTLGGTVKVTTNGNGMQIITYTPPAIFAIGNEDSFDYQLTDQYNQTVSATAHVDYDRGPTAANLTVNISGDNSAEIDVIAAATDPDQPVVSAEVASPPVNANGYIVTSYPFAPANTVYDDLNYIPFDNVTSDDSFTYTVFDALNVTATATVTIHQTAVAVGGPPTSPTAIAGNNQVSLNWTAPSTASPNITYNIYRGNSSGNEDSEPLQSGLTVPTYTDFDALDGLTYFYKITANDPSESAASAEVSASPVIATQSSSVLTLTYDSSDDKIVVSQSGGIISISQPSQPGAAEQFAGISTIKVNASLSNDLLDITTLAGSNTNLNIATGAVTLVASTASGITPVPLASLALAANTSLTFQDKSNAAAKSVLVLGSLSLAGATNNWQSQLDLGRNDLIVQNGGATALANINNQLKSGFNAHTGYWNGLKGIISTNAASDSTNLRTLGVKQNTTSATFDNQSATSANDILVKYTYYGDADLTGALNGSDYQQIDQGFGQHKTGWSNGDFNYDDAINGSDFALIDNAFNQFTARTLTPLTIFAQAPAIIPSSLSTNAKKTTIPSQAANLLDDTNRHRHLPLALVLQGEGQG